MLDVLETKGQWVAIKGQSIEYGTKVSKKNNRAKPVELVVLIFLCGGGCMCWWVVSFLYG